MADITPLRRILNNTAAKATDIDFNDQAINAYLDAEVVQVDGAKAMTAPLTLSATTPTNPLHAARLQDLPTGGQELLAVASQSAVLSPVTLGGAAIPGLIANITMVASHYYALEVVNVEWTFANNTTTTATDTLAFNETTAGVYPCWKRIYDRDLTVINERTWFVDGKLLVTGLAGARTWNVIASNSTASSAIALNANCKLTITDLGVFP